MKRDAEYMIKLLLEFEDSEYYTIKDSVCLNMSPDERKRHYHIQLLCDQGFIVPCSPYSEDPMLRLTAEAHDFIEKIREPKFWDKIQEKAKETIGVDIAKLDWVSLLGIMRSLT